MDVREKLVELLQDENNPVWRWFPNNATMAQLADYLINSGVTVQEDCKECAEATQNCIVKLQEQIAELRSAQEWINSEEMLPEFPCLAIDVNGNSVFIPDGIITIKDKHGEWCIDASLAKEVRLINGTKIDVLIWENRIAYWMPLPKLPQPPKGE